MRTNTNSHSARLVGAATLLCAAAGAASGQSISGTVTWKDEGGLVHPAREVRIEFFGEQMLPGGGAMSVYLGSGATDRHGLYHHTFAPPPGLFFVAARVMAENPAAYVSTDTTPAGTYYIQDGILGTVATIDFPIGNSSIVEQAFSVADAVYTGQYWGGRARTAGAPARVPVVFPEAGPGDASFYRSTDKTLHIREWRRYAWDVIDHEYGHYMSDLDSMDLSPGGGHSSGVSNIPARGKLDGMRLAWGEGLGTFNGIASHHIDPVTQNLPSTMATVGDAVYTAVHSDNPALTFSRGVEFSTGAGNAGEGDEASVYRILWDIADPANEAHDRVERGLVTTYRDLESIAALDRLDDVWDYYFTLAGTDQARTDFGAIFEEYAVSPSPHDGPIGSTLGLGSPAPEFEWDRQNDGENDAFGLIIWDDTFTTRLLDIMIPGNVESYTLSPAQWAVLTTAAAGGPIDLNFVIHGTDATAMGGFAYAPELVSGAYWSDAYKFTVVPAPSGVAILGVGMLIIRRRTRA